MSSSHGATKTRVETRYLRSLGHQPGGGGGRDPVLTILRPSTRGWWRRGVETRYLRSLGHQPAHIRQQSQDKASKLRVRGDPATKAWLAAAGFARECGRLVPRQSSAKGVISNNKTPSRHTQPTYFTPLQHAHGKGGRHAQLQAPR